MIAGVLRAVWMFLCIAAGTFFYGGMAIGAALLGVRGSVYVRWTRGWARASLWGSGCRVVTHGMERLEPGTPFILAANHVSWLDIFAIAAVLPVDYHFVAKKELERIPVFGAAWKAAGHISIDRGNHERAIASLRRAGAQMRSQQSVVVIFAEGTRSRTGRLLPFKKGAFALSRETGIPVVPTVVIGSYDVMRPDTFLVRPATIHLHFEAPVPPDGRTLERHLTEVRDVCVRRLAEAETLPPIEATHPEGLPDDG
jgi:1-acyl-sn-glycerol-3-phosphate acyltransferase